MILIICERDNSENQYCYDFITNKKDKQLVYSNARRRDQGTMIGNNDCLVAICEFVFVDDFSIANKTHSFVRS